MRKDRRSTHHMNKSAAAFFLTTVFFAFTGCVKNTIVPPENILMFDSGGNAVDPTGNISCTRETSSNGLCNGRHMSVLGPDYKKISTEPPEPSSPSDYDKYVQTLLNKVNTTPQTPTASGQGKRKF